MYIFMYIYIISCIFLLSIAYILYSVFKLVFINEVGIFVMSFEFDYLSDSKKVPNSLSFYFVLP